MAFLTKNEKAPKKNKVKGSIYKKNAKNFVQVYFMFNVYSISLMTRPCPHLFIPLLLSFTFTKTKIVSVPTWLHMKNDHEKERKVFPLL